MDELRSKLAGLLRGGDAARPAVEIMREFPYEKGGVVPDGLPYSAWSLIEHLRISQDDILRFSQSAEYEEMTWPDAYWPDERTPPGEDAWKGSIETFEADLEAMIELMLDEERDLLAPFPWGDDQTLLREAVVLAEHNAYHSGQIVVIGRLLDVWP
jgi:uncharacterized damage-inducible protein DinB